MSMFKRIQIYQYIKGSVTHIHYLGLTCLCTEFGKPLVKLELLCPDSILVKLNVGRIGISL